ncbi:M28 family metallopeptidase [Pontibacter beigongshangensis]|uniref:M28 family metallopeptidase n=1 Tax=Pontibacter beigongshangensis TaxID=2574733 RepID=UPI001650C431|nr:M28 family peptidase [Pontibacter beigongshangensis]
MNQQTLLLLLFLITSFPARAQDMSRVRQTIDTLCSPTMHGRGYIFEGDTKAASYIRARFEAAGLQPIGFSYYQPFFLPVNRITHTPQLQPDGKRLNPGTDFVAQAASPSGQGKAKVLPLDTLIFTDATAASRFFNQDFQNKALVYSRQHQPLLQKLPSAYQQQLQRAKAHIVLQPKALMTSVARQQSGAPVFEALATAWPNKVKKVKFDVTANFEPAYQTQNVIAVIEGSIEPDSFLVFTAHYDHLGGQGKDVYFPGANDNASGTAMLLELAAHYSKPENKPAYSIAFMAFAAEEAGLVGSFFYTQNPLFPLSQIKFLVNLDLLGTGDDGLMAVNGSIHPEEFRLLTDLNKAGNYLPQIRSRGKAANSDHYPFSEKGVPAFFFYTLGGTTAYHNVHDRPEQLPLTRFPEVFKLLTDFAAALQTE